MFTEYTLTGSSIAGPSNSTVSSTAELIHNLQLSIHLLSDLICYGRQLMHFISHTISQYMRHLHFPESMGASCFGESDIMNFIIAHSTTLSHTATKPGYHAIITTILYYWSQTKTLTHHIIAEYWKKDWVRLHDAPNNIDNCINSQAYMVLWSCSEWKYPNRQQPWTICWRPLSAFGTILYAYYWQGS
jgi:hypothetical protein